MPVAISIDNMAAEVRRELGFRERVYPRWLQQGKIRPEKAAEQTERMQALLEALEELRLARAFIEASRTEDAFAVKAAWEAICALRHAPLTMGTHHHGDGPAA